MHLRTKFLLLLQLGALAPACSATPDDRDDHPAVLAVSMAVEQLPGVAALLYEVTEVDCGSGIVSGATHTLEAAFHEFALPPVEGLPGVGSDSEHVFADGFFTLAPGCYDIRATPLDELGAASASCAPAEQHAVSVLEGVTTEILLVSQCNGRDFGNLDGVLAVNRPPELKSVSLDPSAFVGCAEVQRLCATLSDPDRDPLEFVWSPDVTNPSAITPVVALRTSDGTSTTECVELVAERTGDYRVTVGVFDQALFDGERLRVEDILALQSTPLPSRYEMTLAFHVSECDADPGGSLSGSIRYTSETASGYCAEVTVRNGTAATVNDWTASLALTDSRLIRSSTYGAAFTGGGSSITARALAETRVLPSGARATFGFCASASGSTPKVTLTSVE